MSQPVHVNGFLPCHSRAHFLSLAPGWEHTMTNTAHIRSIACSQGDKHSDTGVICFCQKHRNSHPTPPGADKAGMHSLACRRGGMCSCCDYLPLQRKGFLWGPMETCSCLPSAMISAPVGSAQRAKVSRPAGGFPQVLVWVVVITFIIEPQHSTLDGCMAYLPSVCGGSRSDIGYTSGLNAVQLMASICHWVMLFDVSGSRERIVGTVGK